MRPARIAFVLCLAIGIMLGSGQGSVKGQDQAFDRAFDKFWRASDPDGAEHAAAELVNSGIDFESAWRRLRAGRRYDRSVATGLVVLSVRSSDLMEHRTRVHVPADYDPSSLIPVRVQLHGRINRQREDGPVRDRANPIEGAREIYVLPAGSAEAAGSHPDADVQCPAVATA